VVRGQKADGRRQTAKKEGATPQAIDVLDNEGRVTVFRGDWIDTPPVRGTGCMLSAAIAACLGKGMELAEAVDAARSFVSDAIRKASDA
jgi:hydroxymethylpyrimidine/phosphomethylpyrimidine kinase